MTTRAIATTNVASELCTKGAGELASMIRARDVTSTEVVDAYLARIEEVNPSVNAVTATLAVAARDAARDIDRAVVAGRSVGPLAGAPLVARLREAGAVPLARTNLPDFAFRWDTMSGVAGRTRNPWDPTRTPGGSSGGEAVALATGMTPLGFGNDLGGSLRVPSQMCGTMALRPSRGRGAGRVRRRPAAGCAAHWRSFPGGRAARRRPGAREQRAHHHAHSTAHGVTA